MVDYDPVDFPCVYLVSVDLPKTLESTFYDLEITMAGLPVEGTPVIGIRPCSNKLAYDLGMIGEVDKVVILDSIDYTIAEDVQTIGLPFQVSEVYCEHTSTILFLSARRITQTDL